jgi:hypothetical protein
MAFLGNCNLAPSTCEFWFAIPDRFVKMKRGRSSGDIQRRARLREPPRTLAAETRDQARQREALLHHRSFSSASARRSVAPKENVVFVL